MDFTFARFALNMAMASSRTDPEVMLKAGAPAFLVGMLSSPNELVRWRLRRARPGRGGGRSRYSWRLSPTVTPHHKEKQNGREGGEGFVGSDTVCVKYFVGSDAICVKYPLSPILSQPTRHAVAGRSPVQRRR